MAALLDKPQPLSLASPMSMVAERARFSPEEARAAARSFDLKSLAADFIDDPFPYYCALREYDPVHHMPDGAYLITRWRDCDAVYRDARIFSSDKKIEFRPNMGRRRSTSITPPAWCSTIRRSTRTCAVRSRWRCRTASSPGWRRGWSRWSTGCSTRWRRRAEPT